MRQYLFVAVLLLVSLSLVSGVSAVNITTDLTNNTGGGTGATTVLRGVTFDAKYNMTLVNVTFDSGTTNTKAYLFWENETYIMNVTLVGRVATFNYYVYANNAYRVYGGEDGGASYTYSDRTGFTFPTDRKNVYYMNKVAKEGVYNTSPTVLTGINVQNIYSITTDRDGVPPSPPLSTNMTISVNNTRSGSLVSGFSWSYVTSNASDTNTKSGYCAGTICSITNFTGLLNITVNNVSGGTFFNPYDSPKNSHLYNATNATSYYAFSTYSNSLSVNLTNVVNGSKITYFCMSVSNSTAEQNNCTSSGDITFYNVAGDTTLFYYNISNNTYYNITQPIGVFNATLTNFTNSTYQSMLIINAKQLFTGASIGTFNVTNWLLTNQTTTGTLTVRANAGANNIKIDVPGNFSKNTTCTAVSFQTAYCNISGIHDGLFKINATNRLNNSAISSFSINAVNTSLFSDNYATSNGTVYIPLLQGYDYSFLINASGYALQNITLRSNTTQNNYSFSLYRAQTIELLFKDELTRANINGTVTIQMISDSMAANYTTSNATLYVDLLLPDVYTFRYQPTGYLEREYTTNIASQSYNNITLYSITYNDSGTVRATVVDTGGTPVEGAIVKLMRYYVYCNCYEVVESGETSASGEIYFNAQFYDGYYKWSVDYNGVNYFLSTSPESLVPNDGETMVTRVFTINLGDDYYDGFTGLSSVGTSCTYNSGNGGLSFTWSDPNGHTSQGCLNAEYLSGVHYATYANTCVQGSTGSIVVTLNNTNTTRYVYTATLVIDGQSYQADSCTGWIEPSSGNHFGIEFGAFIAGGIIITLVMIFSYSAIAVLVISTIGIIFVSALGLMTFSTAFIGGLVVMVLGIGIYLMRS